MKVFSILILTFGFSVVHAQNKAAGKTDAVVASVGARNITLSEFNKKYNDVKSTSINPPTRAIFLEDLVRFEVGVQEAEKKKIEQDPIVKERIRQEIYKGLIEKELGPEVQKIQVSDSEMESWYKNYPEIRISHILTEFKIGATPEQIADAKKRAQEILAEVKKSNRPFEELAKLYSDDTLTNKSGGDIGWQSKVTIVPSIYDPALQLKVGEYKGLVESPFGFHIIKLTGKKAFKDANKKQIRTALFDEKRKKSFDNYFNGLKKRYTIKTNPAALNQ